MTTIERKQSRALSTEEKLERLIKFVNKLVEDHNRKPPNASSELDTTD